MAFDPFETGDGSPVEILTFTNGFESFRYANTVRDITVGVQVFEALAYKLSQFAQSKDTDDNNRTMRVGNDWPVLALYQGAPTSASTLVSVQRFHDDDPAQELQSIWNGRISAVNHVEDECDVLLQPVTNGSESTPPDTFSALCNAFLFQSPGCNLSRDDWRHVGTVTAITVGGLVLTIPGLGAQAAALDAAQGGPTGPLSAAELDVYWQGGYIETGGGELRDIVEGNFGGDPDKVRVVLPFRSVAVLDGVQVFAGCDLSRPTCNKKFDNVLNFQGFADIPEVDPANTELPVGSRETSGGFW